jgi:hypothetical protein
MGAYQKRCEEESKKNGIIVIRTSDCQLTVVKLQVKYKAPTNKAD